MRSVFVDGYNLIGATPALAELQRRDLAAAREALTRRVVARYRHTPHQVVIVFDGDGPVETRQPVSGFTRGQVVYSRRGETADSVIVRLCAETCDAGGQAAVYSNDGEVRQGAAAGGARAARADDLRREMAAAPRLLRQRFTHHQAVRRELDRDGEDTEARAAARKRGASHRPPRNRRRDQ